jgi:hypothetical protein
VLIVLAKPLVLAKLLVFMMLSKKFRCGARFGYRIERDWITAFRVTCVLQVSES